jgi:hypothetical protein
MYPEQYVESLWQDSEGRLDYQDIEAAVSDVLLSVNSNNKALEALENEKRGTDIEKEYQAMAEYFESQEIADT